ncbi:Uma2 family endonuclease [Kitasatospora purpeofusca]|uniref:Uma2 family endonuclease n=1 Tax=Kitasatospora purpeofusca TaxID=67352 RepID=UPI002A5A0DBF|nr:Uma2 family endonuclease [Kitasatospora purpeofusca]MDY0815357.1 Uma2 family endonuclease [Kitasatospora purpeofusca]
MSAAAVEGPIEQPTLLEAAELISSQFAGHRVEIIGSQIVVTPPPNASHGRSLSRLMRVLFTAGLADDDVLQGVGIWLPDGPSDYAVPDLAVVDADIDDHLIEYNCYDPAVFRLVLEVTSSNLSDDLKRKPAVYASAGIPVYVIVDRANARVMVLTDPQDGEYRVHAVHHPGQSFALPESIGAAVTLSVDEVLAAKK